jgi:AcrR family transcriptional regulator
MSYAAGTASGRSASTRHRPGRYREDDALPQFPSKDDLILDFLRRREQLWTREWQEAESRERGRTAREQLLAIFDVFSEWFSQPDFEGCSFLTTMIEVNDREHPVHQAAVGHLANIRAISSNWRPRPASARPGRSRASGTS